MKISKIYKYVSSHLINVTFYLLIIYLLILIFSKIDVLPFILKVLSLPIPFPSSLLTRTRIHAFLRSTYLLYDASVLNTSSNIDAVSWYGNRFALRDQSIQEPTCVCHVYSSRNQHKPQVSYLSRGSQLGSQAVATTEL